MERTRTINGENVAFHTLFCDKCEAIATVEARGTAPAGACIWRMETATPRPLPNGLSRPAISCTTPKTTKQHATSSDGADTAAPPPHLQDHWAARPTQQRALLRRLFQWKADGVGKEVVLLAGAGLAQGCVAAETRLEYSLPAPRSTSPGSEEEEQKQKGGLKTTRDGAGKGNGPPAEEGEEEEKRKKAKRRRIGIEQVRSFWARGREELSHLCW